MKKQIYVILVALLVSINFSIVNAVAAPSNVIIVAKSGGDFISIQAAIESVNPTAETPYIIKVMPGTYIETVTLKSYIHLQGSGREVTTIKTLDYGYGNVITLNGVTNVEITEVTINNGMFGIYNSSSTNVTITGCVFSGNSLGIVSWQALRTTISDNSFDNNASNAIWNASASPAITGNTISGVAGGSAIICNDCSSVIAGNTITGSSFAGIYVLAGSPTIVTNKITGNGTDIYVLGTPNISFNVFDTISGTNGVGAYNVTSNGNPAPAP